MAFSRSTLGRIILGDFSFSALASKAAPTYTATMLDVSTLVDDAKQMIVGQNTSTVKLSGFLDPDGGATSGINGQLDAWTGPEAVTYAPRGLGLGSEVQLLSAMDATWDSDSAVADSVRFNLDLQVTGPTDFGVSLKDLTAETASTNSTGVDGGAASSGGSVANLHVTAYSGFTNVVVKAQHSTDNITFVDLITFSTVTAITQERATSAGTVNRYTRCQSTVTGTGSITYALGLARR